MLNVQKYLLENSLESLIENYKIKIRDYPDRITLNYDQLDSPRFNEICDECRGLILSKPDYKILARSFNRFYNVGEGNQWKTKDVSKAKILTKIDGSLCNLYFDGQKWCVSTRSMAFAEGTTPIGISFKEIFDKALQKTKVMDFVDQEYTWNFELTSPFNRVVTYYPEEELTLLSARNNLTGKELLVEEIIEFSKKMKVKIPNIFSFKNFEEVIETANNLPSMEEGFVLLWENQEGSHYRLKCKNTKYLAIAHLRANGILSVNKIIELVAQNEQHEYLSYFPEDTQYFDFVQESVLSFKNKIKSIYEKYKNIETQKDFALSIMGEIEDKLIHGILFQLRKGLDLEKIIKDMDKSKINNSLNLEENFKKKFFKEKI